MCKKAKIVCRYEEIQFKKPRAVLLHEHVGESSFPKSTLIVQRSSRHCSLCEASRYLQAPSLHPQALRHLHHSIF